MESHTFDSPGGLPRVVGSFGSRQDLLSATAEEVVASCDWVEIRLDRLAARAAGLDPADWRSLAGLPMLFTARRSDEGGEHSLAACERVAMLECALEAAAAIDVEVASIAEMGEILEHARQRGIPWVASFHDFNRLPESAVLEQAVRQAVDAGAAVFKLAARLSGPADLARTRRGAHRCAPSMRGAWEVCCRWPCTFCMRRGGSLSAPPWKMGRVPDFALAVRSFWHSMDPGDRLPTWTH
jgi:hypothetical protein